MATVIAVVDEILEWTLEIMHVSCIHEGIHHATFTNQ